MSDLKSPVLRGKPQSRRQAMKLALLAGSTLAIGASPVLADDASSTPPPMPMVKPGEQGLVKPTSAVTPGTSYLMFSGLDFKPLNSSTNYNYMNFSGIYPATNFDYFATTITLPQRAHITEVEFYSIHNVSDTSYFYLSLASPAIGILNAYDWNTLDSTNPDIVTVPISISGNLPTVDNTNNKYVLLWWPSGTGTSEVLYGARVGYMGGIGRFGT